MAHWRTIKRRLGRFSCVLAVSVLHLADRVRYEHWCFHRNSISGFSFVRCPTKFCMQLVFPYQSCLCCLMQYCCSQVRQPHKKDVLTEIVVAYRALDDRTFQLHWLLFACPLQAQQSDSHRKKIPLGNEENWMKSFKKVMKFNAPFFFLPLGNCQTYSVVSFVLELQQTELFWYGVMALE